MPSSSSKHSCWPTRPWRPLSPSWRRKRPGSSCKGGEESSQQKQSEAIECAPGVVSSRAWSCGWFALSRELSVAFMDPLSVSLALRRLRSLRVCPARGPWSSPSFGTFFAGRGPLQHYLVLVSSRTRDISPGTGRDRETFRGPLEIKDRVDYQGALQSPLLVVRRPAREVSFVRFSPSPRSFRKF